ncbi:cystathionine beta-lyase [Legionella beliardensis]|uniref:Cystathionine beta-lyase n=1 Tax=Legionella beliardensis TaxID=91822 RepID=A0A378I4Y5_9GAMM|nr:PLP-dependent aspartate aminotransferase family protein [Legionella beliardensis]STX29731.1 cystathionine beta-lyase [Legionella beliardensis]
MKKTNATHFILSGHLSLDECRFVNPPVYRGSTVLFKDYDEMHEGKTKHIYGRWSTPTSDIFCEALAELEQGLAAIVTCSGLAAITTCILALVNHDNHIIINQTCYPSLMRFLNEFKNKINLEIDIISAQELACIDNYLKPNTKFVYLDIPGTFCYEIPDVALVKKQIGSIPLIVDNTWATPYFFNPLTLGADIVIHSTSKYIAGHSDSIMGSIVFKDENLYDNVLNTSRLLGQYAGADDLAIAYRGLKTLPVRMNQHYQHALHAADWLTQQSQVEAVFYPPLPASHNHALWQKQFHGGSGLLCFLLKDDKKVSQLLNQLQLFRLGFGWGGYESLATSMIVTQGPWQDRQLIRLNIGLEDKADIMRDLQTALSM